MADQPIEHKPKINSTHLNAYSTGLLQGKAYNRMHTLLSSTLARYQISVPEWKLLGQLHDNDKVRLSELASRLSYDPPMVTKLAKSLEKRNLVKRLADLKDERAKVIKITPKGSILIKEIEPEVKKTMSLILNGVSRDELLNYIKVLTLIVDNTQE